MRLVRVGPAGSETPGVLVDDDTFVDLSDVVGDFNEAFFGSGALATLGQVVAERVDEGRGEPLAGRRFGAPIARPHQILCIGLNYSDHAAETGQAVPDEPILFTKSPNTLVGPDDDVLVPKGSEKTDWEVELGIVIGRHSLYLADEAEAAASIAGYVLVNDVSERAWQIERNGQWSKGKSAPTFNPAGPYLVTPDEVGDVLDLDMTLDIDGQRRQNGSTSTMVFSPHFIVHYLSQFMALEPGDLINTGTPPGVGMGQKPPVYLRGGEAMTLSITRLGTQTQRVVGHSDTAR
ncbi:fumarylacetoacetate hydrolase family protein [Demequina aurantiaca]|uniref:fumarylacetoacetate hydrolase family protein n=1 Tax=Demequina aurantiaca TaxID=676200 RepID=UPI003D32651B